MTEFSFCMNYVFNACGCEYHDPAGISDCDYMSKDNPTLFPRSQFSNPIYSY